MDNTDIKINIPQSQYVYVAKNLSGEGAIMLPIKSDGSLALKTVCVLFPDVIELEYKCTSTGLFRQLLMDPQKTFFYEPLDGWADKKFVAICKKEEPVYYVRVAKNHSGDEMKTISTDLFGSLDFGTLSVYFPGVVGLEYKCPSSGLVRQLIMNSDKTKFLQPDGEINGMGMGK